MDPIFSMTALLRTPGEVKEAARKGLVRITEQGGGGFVLFGEQAFADYIEHVREAAVAEARVTDSIDRGISDIEEGQFVDTINIAFARAEEARSQNG